MCGDLEYHCALVDLLSCCTEGKNYNTEIKCHGLLPLDDITQVMTSPLCLPQIKQVYAMFLVHCYIDTESEMKEVYNSRHIWHLFNHFTKGTRKNFYKFLKKKLQKIKIFIHFLRYQASY